jgi:hypothetical protein
MARFLKRADGRVFARSVIGFATEEEALQEFETAQEAGPRGKGRPRGDRWQVWRSVR